jgi:cytochrome c oxidase accessory protein FixG
LHLLPAINSASLSEKGSMNDVLEKPDCGGCNPSVPSIRECGDDFRDRLATAEKDGTRRWLYPKQVKGAWYRRRTWFSYFLLGLMFIVPFIKIRGNPLLMLNIVERKFSILGQIFWPADSAIFAIAILVFLTSIIVFTTAFGRLWCGWACPQTVLMEMVFRKIEYLIEGDASAQRALDRSSWTTAKFVKKALKHGTFITLSFLIGNWLLSYVVGIEKLQQIVLANPREHITGLSFMLLFSAIFYLIFARFREQACTFICPYGRFQSAILDENTMVVAYDHRRGETRGALHRDQNFDDRIAEGVGDCINCRQCVAVCPTGIDIRNGTQMECVNCTACIDACDSVMRQIGRPPGLVRYASYNSIEKRLPFRFTARMGLYSAVLSALVVLFFVLLFTRSDVQSIFLRAPGALFQSMPDGKISNLYTLKILNKVQRDLPIELRLDKVSGELTLMGGGRFVVPKEGLAETSVLIAIDPAHLPSHKTKLHVGVYSSGKRLETINTIFIGPRN